MLSYRQYLLYIVLHLPIYPSKLFPSQRTCDRETNPYPYSMQTNVIVEDCGHWSSCVAARKRITDNPNPVLRLPRSGSSASSSTDSSTEEVSRFASVVGIRARVLISLFGSILDRQIPQRLLVLGSLLRFAGRFLL